MRSNTDPSFERPLSGPAKLVLMTTAAATIGLFYILISGTIFFLLVWIGLELVLTLAATRIGLAGWVVKYLQRHLKLLGLLAGSLWLRRGAEYRIKLKHGEAPGLVAIMRKLCSRLKIPLPDAIFLEMNAGAWVELKGLRQNLGRTHLGIGYDLLAGLTEQEIEAVLAHELAHAKLIHRALKNWLNSGLSRAARVSTQLSGIANTHRRANETFTSAEMILGVADGLTRWCARLVAAYSRQDEFEADRGAAELCGAAPLRSALQRLDLLHATLDRLSWNERRAQIQSEEGLSRWLAQELTKAAAHSGSQDEWRLHNKYSTHPSTRDRLSALPDDGSQLSDSPSGIHLLTEPDAAALKLLHEIERTLLAEEQKDLKGLRQWVQRARRGRRTRPIHWFGLLFILGGLIGGLASLDILSPLGALELTAALLGIGGLLFKLSRYQDRAVLPLPDYAALKAAWSAQTKLHEVEAKEKILEKELREKIFGEARKHRQAEILGQEAYQALAGCDYLRAHVASRLCHDLDHHSVEGSLALAIASAAFKMEDQSYVQLEAVRKETSLRTPTVVCGSAWALTLLGAWMPAEALWHEALHYHPEDPTLLALLAICQSRRGKRQSAVANIRKACLPSPASPEHAKLLIQLLLDLGDLREAQQWLQKLGLKSHADREVQFCWIRLHLLRRQFTEAAPWIAQMETTEIPGDTLVAIGGLFESARDDAGALAFYQRALACGHYPEAQLGLARLAAQSRDKTKARAHILASLDTTKLFGEKAVSVHQVFPAAIAQLLALQQPAADCKAWIAGFLDDLKSGPLNRRSLMIYAQQIEDAEAHLRTLLQAMEPNTPPLASAYFKIKLAPKDLQPTQPVPPGVQHFYK